MINTVEQLVKRLEAGELVSLTRSSSRSYELIRAEELGVTGDVASAVVNEFIKNLSTSVRIYTCMFPSCGPGHYLGSVNNLGANRYEVEIRWVNRPNEPVTFD